MDHHLSDNVVDCDVRILAAFVDLDTEEVEISWIPGWYVGMVVDLGHRTDIVLELGHRTDIVVELGRCMGIVVEVGHRMGNAESDTEVDCRFA